MSVIARAALLAGVLAGQPCSADVPLWVGGWGVWGTTDLTSGQYVRLPLLQAFVPEGADTTVLPQEFNGLPGRELHFLGADGKTGSARVERIQGAEEAGVCLPEIIVPQPPVSLEAFFLASTAPINVAPAEEIARTDTRLSAGIARYLRISGVIAPKIKIVRALAADLDGDGKMEAVVEAITTGRDIGETGVYEPGDFSIVAIGSLTGASYVVSDHVGYIYNGERTPSRFGILALPAFEIAGRFDIAITYSGWEWAGIDVYAWSEGSARLVASAYCGL